MHNIRTRVAFAREVEVEDVKTIYSRRETHFCLRERTIRPVSRSTTTQMSKKKTKKTSCSSTCSAF